ncbi:hypothetical protein L2E82_40181 [Cichorium intybus]|uniref:Uncharacterized protein n=1 Tax=Cichorium intybus TaxID=13427 RepID=A0ACB9AKY4_CICIN|nr:hypothetical protein L2E82_40181 [Cichorium intybus]
MMKQNLSIRSFDEAVRIEMQFRWRIRCASDWDCSVRDLRHDFVAVMLVVFSSGNSGIVLVTVTLMAVVVGPRMGGRKSSMIVKTKRCVLGFLKDFSN